MLRALTLLLHRLSEEVSHALQSHSLTAEIEAPREVGVGGMQVKGGQEVDGSFHLRGIIQMNLEAHGSPAIRI